mmetsp:Transcript_132971/g.258876  ORF Transcript_132971/g.258876 Transcript_132971/m.258876 type:complete len:266 (-) Transcript_132971:153-950(-)
MPSKRKATLKPRPASASVPAANRSKKTAVPAQAANRIEQPLSAVEPAGWQATACKQPLKNKGKKVGVPGAGSSSVDTGVMKRPADVAADNFMEEALRSAIWRADAEAARADAACAKAVRLEKELTVANLRLGELRRSEMHTAEAEVTKTRVEMRELTKGHMETLKQRDALLEKNRVLLQKKDACPLEKKEANLQELLMQLKSKDEQLKSKDQQLTEEYRQTAVERKEAVTILKMIELGRANGQLLEMSPLSPISGPVHALQALQV